MRTEEEIKAKERRQEETGICVAGRKVEKGRGRGRDSTGEERGYRERLFNV